MSNALLLDSLKRQSSRVAGANSGGATGNADHLDRKALERDLAERVEGEVRFERGTLGLYATDSSNFREAPIGVVIPQTPEAVVEAHRVCCRYGAPVLNRGCGTSLSGETVNFAVVIDHSKFLTRIGDPDSSRRLVTVQPGAINEQVNKKTGRVNLVFGPDPSTHAYCTIGGNVGNNSCGIHSIQSQIYGPGPRTSDNVHSMEIVTYRGERFRVGTGEESQLEQIIAEGGAKGEVYRRLRQFRDEYADEIRRRFRPVNELPRRVSGYNLDELLPERGFNVARSLVGTESTCVTALEVTLMLTPALLKRQTAVLEYDTLPDAAAHIGEILEWKPIGLEALDHRLFVDANVEHRNVQTLCKLPRPGEGKGCWLLVEFGADTEEDVRETAQRFREWLIDRKHYEADRIVLFGRNEPAGPSDEIWKIREAGLGATAFPPDSGDHWPGWEDSAVPPDKVGPYVRDLKKLYDKYHYVGAMYGHFGQGCIHSRISFDLRTALGIRDYRNFLDEASDLVVSYGGSLSGEHGDGQQRAEFLVKQYGSKLLEAMHQFKKIWDPDWKMNPGKVIDPYPLDSYLKLGVNYAPPQVQTRFSYANDGGSFAHATLRCVGAGKCREPKSVDVMCPSYMVTREEKHSTRGRARLLFEMLQGDIVQQGWQSKEVYDALELCLACKGCTNDCPVHVDMPTYKSEFLYHHYKSLRRLRPRYAYAFGFIDQFARLASLIPELVNFVTQNPLLSRVAKFAAGMDQRRRVPAFAPLTLQSWFRRRGGTSNTEGPRVILWPDTFNNHFHTNVGRACVDELEAAGYSVVMPSQHVCCGRPLYDYGFLDMAEIYLRRSLAVLRTEIRKGTPVIGMEPSCLAPKLGKKAILWGHCHHKATGGMSAEMKVLKEKLGLDVEEAKGGCCGLAGSWGFETGKYGLSMQCGEIGLLPAARKAARATVIIADGFSCQTQLEESDVGRKALHTAEVMRIARTVRDPDLRPGFPERLRPEKPRAPLSLKIIRTAATAGLFAAAAIGAFKGISKLASRNP